MTRRPLFRFVEIFPDVDSVIDVGSVEGNTDVGHVEPDQLEADALVEPRSSGLNVARLQVDVLEAQLLGLLDGGENQGSADSESPVRGRDRKSVEFGSCGRFRFLDADHPGDLVVVDGGHQHEVRRGGPEFHLSVQKIGVQVEPEMAK